MAWDKNVYYDPEKFGLTLLDSVDLEDEPYQFFILAAWKDEQGYYLATDSGCSCPTPFDNYGGRDDLTGPLTASQAIEEATSLRPQTIPDEQEWTEFLAKLT